MYGILLFWANHGKKFPTWALAMQIVGSFTPNSAAAERVFSLLKLMFGRRGRRRCRVVARRWRGRGAPQPAWYKRR